MQSNQIKCPACGAILEPYATRCNSCGNDMHNVQASQTVLAFTEKLDEIEAKRPHPLILNDDIGCGAAILWFFFFWILLPVNAIKMIMKKDESELWDHTDARQESMIMNFPIPISKSEILDFATLASSRVTTVPMLSTLKDQAKYRIKWNKIWTKKLEQINTKASIAMKSDPHTLALVNQLMENARNINARNSKNQGIMLGISAGVAFLVVAFFIIIGIS